MRASRLERPESVVRVRVSTLREEEAAKSSRRAGKDDRKGGRVREREQGRGKREELVGREVVQRDNFSRGLRRCWGGREEGREGDRG